MSSLRVERARLSSRRVLAKDDSPNSKRIDMGAGPGGRNGTARSTSAQRYIADGTAYYVRFAMSPHVTVLTSRGTP